MQFCCRRWFSIYFFFFIFLKIGSTTSDMFTSSIFDRFFFVSLFSSVYYFTILNPLLLIDNITSLYNNIHLMFYLLLLNINYWRHIAYLVFHIKRLYVSTRFIYIFLSIFSLPIDDSRKKRTHNTEWEEPSVNKNKGNIIIFVIWKVICMINEF